MIDWGQGRYERTAADLLPAAEHVVGLAGVAPGTRVLDVACGTGNGAVLAARAGGDVTGLDSAVRLLDVARDRAAAAGLDATFVLGDAQELPFEDASFDVVLSLFGVIFAADGERAMAEILRVLRPGGRALVTAWVPDGPIHEAVSHIGRAVSEATGRAPAAPFAWHDPAVVGEAAERLGAVAEAGEAALTFSAASPEDFVALWHAEHPGFLSARALLEPLGAYEPMAAGVLAALRGGNEDPGAFRVTTRYRVVTLRRP